MILSLPEKNKAVLAQMINSLIQFQVVHLRDGNDGGEEGSPTT